MRRTAATTPRRGLLAAREAGLAGLVAMVTWGATVSVADPSWSYLECSEDSPWFWVLLGGGVLVCLLRLVLPSVAVVVAAGLFGLWPGVASVLVLTAFQASARIRPALRRRTAVGLAAVTDVGVALLSAQFGWSIVVVGHAVALAICLGLPIGVQVLLRKLDRLISALRERTHYLEENYRLAQSAARLQERSRIAQEMHDQLGHRLSLISLYAGALELATTTGAKAEQSEARLIRSTVHTAMQELRMTLGVLRTADRVDPQLQPVEETGTRSDVARLIAQSRSAGVPVQMVWRGDDLELAAASVRRAVHRLVREGLTNVHRHASGASAWVIVERGRDRVKVEVVNNRPAVAVPRRATAGTGLGLVGVQERVRLHGGSFSAGPTWDGGFHVIAELPLEESTGSGELNGCGTDRLDDGSPLGRVSSGVHRGTHRRGAREGWKSRGITTVLGAGLVGVAALVLAVLNVVPVVVPGESPYGSTGDPQIGMTRAELLDIIYEDDEIARLAAEAIEPPPPTGATCLYSQMWDEEGGKVVRYCLSRDRIIKMDQFVVPRPDPGGP